MRAAFSFVLVAVAVVSSSPAAAQTTCDAPQVLLVLDRSSSMGVREPLPDGTLKWDAAVEAIDVMEPPSRMRGSSWSVR